MKQHFKRIAILNWSSLSFIHIAVLFSLLNTSFVQASFLVENHGVTASDAAEGDRFGSGIAISGDTAVIGAPDNDDSGANMGSAYIFVRRESGWVEQAKLLASDAADESDDQVQFGGSVAISGDTVVVGADWSNHAGRFSGAIYVFVRSGTSWNEQAILVGSDTEAFDFLGNSVAIHEDTLVAGSVQADDSKGAAYVFTRNGTLWTEQAKLMASDAATGSLFPSDIAIVEDTIVIGASDQNDFHEGQGSAYVFNRNDSEWSQQTKLTASDAAMYDHFGYTVGISGNNIVVGAVWDDEQFENSGAVYVFSPKGETWKEQTKILDPDPARGASFRESLAATEDTLVVGDDVYRRDGDAWRHRATVRPSDMASWGLGHSKWSVGLSNSMVIVGATGSKGAGFNSGSAYLFDLDCNAENHIPQTNGIKSAYPAFQIPTIRLLLYFAMIPLESMEQTGWCLKTLGGGKERLIAVIACCPEWRTGLSKAAMMT